LRRNHAGTIDLFFFILESFEGNGIDRNFSLKKYKRLILQTMAAATMTSSTSCGELKVNVEKCQNFMRQFRDPQSREMKKLTANQFMEVWSHYDKDGESPRYPYYCME